MRPLRLIVLLSCCLSPCVTFTASRSHRYYGGGNKNSRGGPSSSSSCTTGDDSLVLLRFQDGDAAASSAIVDNNEDRVVVASITSSPSTSWNETLAPIFKLENMNNHNNNGGDNDTNNNADDPENNNDYTNYDDGGYDSLPHFSSIVSGLAQRPLGSLKKSDYVFLQRFFPKAPGWIPRTIEAALELESILKRLIDEKKYHHHQFYNDDDDDDDIDDDNSTIEITAATYAAVVEVWAMVGVPERAQEIHDAMILHHYTPTIESYNGLLLAWGRNLTRVELIWQDVCAQHERSVVQQQQWHQKSSSTTTADTDTTPPVLFQPIDRTFYRILDAYSRANHELRANAQSYVRRCEELFESMHTKYNVQRHISTFMALQRVYGRSDLPDADIKVLAVLQRLRDMYRAGDENAKPHVMNCNQVLNVYSRANTQSGAQKAIQFFHDMEKPIDEGGYDVKPDRMSYSMLIQACSRAVDAPVFAATKSEEYLEYTEQKCREEKAQQDMISSAAPLQLYLKADDFNLVLIAISRSHQRNGPQRAIRIIKRMQQYAKEGQEDLLPNIKSWTALLHTLARNVQHDSRLVEKGEELVEWLHTADEAGMPDVKPDAFTYAGLLCLYKASNHVEAPMKANAALIKLEQLFDEGKIDFCPDVYHYSIVVGAWASTSRADACDQILSLLARAVKRTRVTTRLFDTALQKLARHGRGQDAEELLDYMLVLDRKGFPEARPSASSFVDVIFAHVKSGVNDAGTRAEAVLTRLLALADDDGRGLYVTFRPFVHLIRYYSLSSAPDAPYRAEYVLNLAVARIRDGTVKAQIPVSVVVDVIKIYSHARHPDSGQNAERLLRLCYKLHQEGILESPVDAVLVSAVMKAWGASNDDDRSRRAERHLQAMVEEFTSGNKLLQPTTQAFMALLGAWAYSKDPNRPEETLRCLRWMESFSKTGIRGGAVEVDEQAKSSVLVACNLIGTSQANKEHVEKAFGIAKVIFDEIVMAASMPGHRHRPLSYHPTFAYYLQACAILDDGDARKFDEVERCFTLCQQAGLVSTLVWKCLHDLYPEPFAKKLSLGAKTYSVPMHWRRNLNNRP